jgi:hypothetical protein
VSGRDTTAHPAERLEELEAAARKLTSDKGVPEWRHFLYRFLGLERRDAQKTLSSL